MGMIGFAGGLDFSWPVAAKRGVIAIWETDGAEQINSFRA
jgi:hypothetical protein